VSPAQKWLYRGTQLLFLALVAWGVARQLGPDLRRLSAADLARWRPNASLLLISTVMVVCINVAHAFFWRRIVGDIVGSTPAVATTLRVFFVSSLGRYIPGRVWQIAGLALLSQRAGIPAMHAAAAGMIGQMTFVTIGVVFLVILLPGWAGTTPLWIALLLTAVIALLFYLLARTPAGARARAWAAHQFGERVASTLAVADRIRPGHAVVWTLGYTLSWLALGAAFFVFTIAFAPDAAGSYGHIAGTVAASYLAGYIAVVVPAGIGVREAVMSVLLSQVVPVSAALLISLASRLWFMAGELLPLVALPFLRTPAASGGSAASTPVRADREL
jgi:hypothetical protein